MTAPPPPTNVPPPPGGKRATAAPPPSAPQSSAAPPVAQPPAPVAQATPAIAPSLQVPPPPPPPPPPSAYIGADARSPRAAIPQAASFLIEDGESTAGDRVLIFGAAGVGKSTLANMMPGPVFLDLEGSTRRFRPPPKRVQSNKLKSWTDLRSVIAGIEKSPPAGMQTLIIDTATMAEDWAAQHVVATRKTEKGFTVDSVEGFGWGKGWQFVYDEFTALMADLDRVCEKYGINIVLISHCVSSPAPNPAGDDYIRWEPHLYSGDKKGRGSIREAVFNWADHALFVAFDVFAKDGKGVGSGSRSIYTTELPTHRAKSRTLPGMFGYEIQTAPSIWTALKIRGTY